MTHNATEILSQRFPNLSQEDLAELASVAQICSYPADIVLCQEGHIEEIFYIIVSGKVGVTQQLDQDTQHFLKYLEPGEFFGEIALLQEGPRIATITTAEPTTVLEIHSDAFMSVLQRSPPMAIRIMLEVTRRLRDADQRAIAGLRRKNVELVKAYAALEEQQQQRTKFLTTVAHELRTPLTAAIGYLKLINSDMVQPEQTSSFLETVDDNLEAVVHLVNNILFLQELDMITPVFEPLKAEEVVLQAVRETVEQATEAGLTVSTSIESGVPQILGDAGGLSRAVSALLDNAVKFSCDGGEITVRLWADSGTLRIEIHDSGIGFPTTRSDDVFEPFKRIEPNVERLFGGVGLGLPIAKHIVELHGGHIETQSQEGKGSTFTIVLPVARETKA